MRILALSALLLVMGGCAAVGEEGGQWDAALYALGAALVQFGNQQMEAEQWRQWQVQQSMPRQAVCYNHGSFLSCATY
jgi:hypothetical protein